MKKALIIISILVIATIVAIIIFKKQLFSLFDKVSDKSEPEYEPEQNVNLFEGAEASGVVFNSNVNNPLNIRANAANVWRGKTTKYGAVFESFDTVISGIRAAIKTLLTYFEKHGLNTVEKIISRWSPDTENDTVGYINFVCKQTGFEPDQVLTPDMHTIFELSKAMAKMENAYDIKYPDYENAWNSI